MKKFIVFSFVLILATGLYAQDVIAEEGFTKIIWFEDQYDEDYGEYSPRMLVNQKYIREAAEPVKAILAYYSAQSSIDCYWEDWRTPVKGEPNKDMSNLDCHFTRALNVGYQCSDEHFGFIEKWFGEKPKVYVCVPSTATHRMNIGFLEIKVDGNLVTVNYERSKGSPYPGDWKQWKGIAVYKINDDSIKVVSRVEK